MERSALHRKLKSLGVASARAEAGACPASPTSTAASCRMREAVVHIEDRGYQFADGVYEVWAVCDGRLVDERPLRPAGAQPRRAAHRRADEPPRLPWCCTRPCAATACATASSTCRSPAASRGATTPSRRPARGRASWSPSARSTAPREARADAGRRRDHHAGEPLGAVRHQDRRPAAQRAGQAEGARGGRGRGLVRRRMGFVTEGASSNAWIVDARRTLAPGDTSQHPARRHPPVVLERGREAGSRSRSGRSPPTRRWRRGRPSSPRRARSCCRWCGSTASRSATASRDRSPARCARDSTSSRKSPLYRTRARARQRQHRSLACARFATARLMVPG